MSNSNEDTGHDGKGSSGANGGCNGYGGSRPPTGSLFSGCGGMDLGLRQAGFDIMAACQWDEDLPEIARAYSLNNSGVHLIDADIRLAATKDAICRAFLNRPCVVLIGGPPCTPYSTSGQRDPNDPRGRLLDDYIELVRRLWPKLIVIENVTGILRARKGEQRPPIEAVISSLERLGYRCEYRTLNAADYGVPQIRRRVIILATRLGGPIVFPEPTHAEGGDLFGSLRPWVTIGEAIDDLKDWPEDRDFWHIFTRHTAEFVNRIRTTPIGGHCGGLFRDGYRRVPSDQPSTIIKSVAWPLHYCRDRALTAREAARIQGFPDWFTFVGRQTAVAKMIGNAVPPPLAKAVAEAVLRMLSDGSGSRAEPCAPANFPCACNPSAAPITDLATA